MTQKIEEKITWSSSTDGEIFSGEYATREEAIRDISENFKQYYIAKNRKVILDQILDVKTLLEDIQVKADDLCGEVAEGYLYDFKSEDEGDLNKLIKEFLISRGYEPDFWTVYDSEKIK